MKIEAGHIPVTATNLVQDPKKQLSLFVIGTKEPDYKEITGWTNKSTFLFTKYTPVKTFNLYCLRVVAGHEDIITLYNDSTNPKLLLTKHVPEKNPELAQNQFIGLYPITISNLNQKTLYYYSGHLNILTKNLDASFNIWKGVRSSLGKAKSYPKVVFPNEEAARQYIEKHVTGAWDQYWSAMTLEWCDYKNFFVSRFITKMKEAGVPDDEINVVKDL